MIKFDYIIVGSGFAGTVIAERIANILDKKILIIEKRNHIAGNCFDYKDENNILVHKYGPHLFHTDNEIVHKYLSTFATWDLYQHKVLASIDGKQVPIPFNLNTLFEVFPQTLAKKIEKKLLEKFNYNSKVPILELKNSEDKDLKFLANFIYEKIFLHYTAKQWDMKPEDIDKSVTARIPIIVGRDDRYFQDKYQYLPHNGFTQLFENMLNHPNIKLLLNTDFHEVCELKTEGLYLCGNKFEGKIIYTGEIDNLFDYKFGELSYRSLDMQLETLNVEYYQSCTTVNYPNNYDFTRITEFKHLYPNENKYTTILKEYPQTYKRTINIPYYPIFTSENQKKYEQYFKYSKQYKNLILLGRLAEYKYYDMDDIVERALMIFEKEIQND
jgi:UDP-galactopyranose mutase